MWMVVVRMLVLVFGVVMILMVMMAFVIELGWLYICVMSTFGIVFMRFLIGSGCILMLFMLMIFELWLWNMIWLFVIFMRLLVGCYVFGLIGSLL